MSRAPEATLMDAVLGSCETRLKAAVRRLSALQDTLRLEAERLSGLERSLTDVPAEGAPSARDQGKSPPPLSAPPPAAAVLASAATAARPAGARRWRLQPRGGAALPPRPWWGIAAALLAICTLAFVALGRGGDSPPRGLLLVAHEPTLVRLGGTVRLWQAASDWTIVEHAAVVRPGDRIQTGPGAYAAVTWPSGAAASLDPQATVSISSPTAHGLVRLELAEGALWLDGGHEPGSPRVEALTPDGARVTGARYRLQRDAAGRLVVASTDAPLEIVAQDTRREVPPASSSEVLLGQRPTLPQPLTAPPALALTVDGPPAWLLVDGHGRVAGAPPGGGPWLDLLPGVRGPLPRPQGAGIVVPNPTGDYQVVLWAGDQARDYQVVAWPTSGQALFGGSLAEPDAGALRLQGAIPAGGSVALALAAEDRKVAVAKPARVLDGLPGWLRLAAAPPSPPANVASPAPPAAAPAEARESPPPSVQRPPVEPPAVAPPAPVERSSAGESQAHAGPPARAAPAQEEPPPAEEPAPAAEPVGPDGEVAASPSEEPTEGVQLTPTAYPSAASASFGGLLPDPPRPTATVPPGVSALLTQVALLTALPAPTSTPVTPLPTGTPTPARATVTPLPTGTPTIPPLGSGLDDLLGVTPRPADPRLVPTASVSGPLSPLDQPARAPTVLLPGSTRVATAISLGGILTPTPSPSPTTVGGRPR